MSDRESWVQPHRRPPRARFDYALLKAAGDRTEVDAIALLSDAVHQGLTTAERLVEVVDRLPRLPRRALLREVLDDVRTGTRSVLEQRYLRDVERAHGLPRGRRNRYRGGLRHRSDVGYDDYGVLVELDGRLGHVDEGRFRDFRRDNDFAVRSLITLRYGWHDVSELSCDVAQQVGTVITSRGWIDEVQRCRRCRRVVW